MVNASGITSLNGIPAISAGTQNGNTGILPIFKMLIDKLNELEPGQQQELKSLLKVNLFRTTWVLMTQLIFEHRNMWCSKAIFDRTSRFLKKLNGWFLLDRV